MKRLFAAGFVLVTVSVAQAQELLPSAAKQAALDYWRKPDRYQTSIPESAKRNGLYVVRLTPEGSFWVYSYNRKRGITKAPPGTLPGPQNEAQRGWHAWFESKLKWDEYQSGLAANTENEKNGFPTIPLSPALDPGPAPAALVEFAGEPPIFAEAVSPVQWQIQFEDGTYSYTDNVTVPKLYAYYRFREGVRSGGKAVKSMPAEEIEALFSRAGLTEKHARIMRGVSLLEGGFDSINTYDTGFLSVGVIQFAALSAGGGALGAVLQEMESSTPQAFYEHFQRYGIDVSAEGKIQALDLQNAVELEGPAAVMQIIADKRLTAVFQRAGEKSPEFRIAQLKVAFKQFYPAEDELKIPTRNGIFVGKVSDVFRSEAGIATLMDVKVNRGSLVGLAELLTKCAEQCGATSLDQLARFEWELIEQMAYRHDFLSDTELSKPATPTMRVLPSRSGGPRRGRGG
jgi:hypothetical protein